MGKSEFSSINYTRVVCNKCGEETTIEPGAIFSELNCKCKGNDKQEPEQTENTLDTEISTPVQEELDYTTIVTVIGTFENGDLEVCYANDLENTFRVPKDTFDNTFEQLNNETVEVNPELIPAGDEFDDLLDGDQDETVNEDKTESKEITLSLNDLKDKTADQIKDEYTVDALRVLAKECKVRSYSQMNEDKLVAALIKKAK